MPDSADTASPQASENRPDEQVLQELYRYLDQAPTQLQPWAQARLEAIREGSDRAVELLQPTLAQAETDEVVRNPQAALDELGEEDEAPVIITPQDRPRPIPAPQRGMSSMAKIVLALVAAIAIGFGVWIAGSPAQSPMPDMPPAGAGPDPAEIQGRIVQLEEEKQASPNDPEVCLELGLHYFNLGNLPAARSNWEHVVEIDDKNIQAWYNLGFLYVSLDPPENDRAKAAWERVVELDPESPLAKTVQNHMSALISPKLPPEDG